MRFSFKNLQFEDKFNESKQNFRVTNSFFVSVCHNQMRNMVEVLMHR